MDRKKTAIEVIESILEDLIYGYIAEGNRFRINTKYVLDNIARLGGLTESELKYLKEKMWDDVVEGYFPHKEEDEVSELKHEYNVQLGLEKEDSCLLLDE